MNVTEYQNLTVPQIRDKLINLPVEDEWRAFQGLNYQYSPRVDISVGPFSAYPNPNQMEEYNRILQTENVNNFLRAIYQEHIENVNDWAFEINVPDYEELIQKNQNARCFLAFEIENTSTRKHIMGSMVNAASLGRIGIGIAYNESVKRTFIRILNYLAFLKRVEKNTYDTTNFLIITREQFDRVLNE